MGVESKIIDILYFLHNHNVVTACLFRCEHFLSSVSVTDGKSVSDAKSMRPGHTSQSYFNRITADFLQ